MTGRHAPRAGRRGVPDFARFASSFSDIFEDLFGWPGSADGGGRERGADLRYNMEITLEKPSPARPPRSRFRFRHLRPVGTAQGRHQAEDLLVVRGAGRSAGAGIFHAGANLPRLSVGGRYRRPVSSCAGSACDAGRTLSSISRRRGRRHAHSACGKARRRSRRRRGSLHFSVPGHALFFQRDGADLHCRVPISM